VGERQTQLGLLLFPASFPPSSDLVNLLEPLLRRANKGSPTFAQISLEMCMVVDEHRAKALPKSSKGTIQRGVAYEVYKEEITKLYQTTHTGDIPKRSLQEIKGIVRECIEQAAKDNRDLSESTDLFSWGVNSLMATAIRNSLSKVNLGET